MLDVQIRNFLINKNLSSRLRAQKEAKFPALPSLAPSEVSDKISETVSALRDCCHLGEGRGLGGDIGTKYE